MVLLPVLHDLVQGLPAPEELWEAIARDPAMSGILANGRVSEEGGRNLTFAEWRRIWEAAVSDEQLELGVRQRRMVENACASIQHLSELRGIAATAANGLGEALAKSMDAEIVPNLPAGTRVSPTVHLVLGTSSGGFFSGSDIYVDLNLLRHLADDPEAVRQFLAHEIWHTGHSAAVEGHRMETERWFGPLFRLQSEGIVNCVIGGTHEQYARVAVQTSDQEARDQARAFLDYVCTIESHPCEHLDQLSVALQRLLRGDIQAYRDYEESLPDQPGYLHGLHMAKAIDHQLGRDVLIATVPDPLAFLLAYQQAALAGGRCRLPDALIQLVTDLQH
jgi:hypothetical protein